MRPDRKRCFSQESEEADPSLAASRLAVASEEEACDELEELLSLLAVLLEVLWDDELVLPDVL